MLCSSCELSYCVHYFCHFVRREKKIRVWASESIEGYSGTFAPINSIAIECSWADDNHARPWVLTFTDTRSTRSFKINNHKIKRLMERKLVVNASVIVGSATPALLSTGLSYHSLVFFVLNAFLKKVRVISKMHQPVFSQTLKDHFQIAGSLRLLSLKHICRFLVLGFYLMIHFFVQHLLNFSLKLHSRPLICIVH
jgi:hypothetical protein